VGASRFCLDRVCGSGHFASILAKNKHADEDRHRIVSGMPRDRRRIRISRADADHSATINPIATGLHDFFGCDGATGLCALPVE